MAAASALKMVAAVCVVMLMLLGRSASAGYQPELPPLGGGAGLACPSAESACRARCRPRCNALSLAICQKLCTIQITPLGSTCVNNMVVACATVCQTTCQIMWSS